jgi:uncharacterized glyoxalase superfamily protein PhnB
MPEAAVIPVLSYPDVGLAVGWLVEVFGFTERLRIGDHRAQLTIGDGAVVVRQVDGSTDRQRSSGDSVMVRIDDVSGHHRRAVELGARIVELPADQPYGERQYTVADLEGRQWTFSETLADSDPHDWGGELR